MPAPRPHNSDAANGPVTRPHYRRVYEDIERRILSGDLVFGAQLPLLPELCSQYGVSEAPIRRALDELSRVGLIVRKRGRGKGTFVQKRITPPTILRVLLIGFDLSRSVIEAYHEIYGLLDGVRRGAAVHGFVVQTVGEDAMASLAPPPKDVRLGYLVLSQTPEEYETGGDGDFPATHAPRVLFNTPRPLPGRWTVSVDMEQGAFLGTDHLASLGHRRIAYVGSTRGGWFAPRYAGYQRALRTHGLAEDQELVRETSGLNAGEDAAALDALLALAEPPTAVFACSDYRALHLLNHAQNRLGLAVPGDLSLCGYDDISICETVSPTLTSVYHPLSEQGEEAVEMLFSLLEGAPASEEKHRVLAPRLRVRQSSVPPGG
ncbi:MAG: GntR family transcriptional regulator [Akkermansiaceae bacterium]|nr:GntR family transcriptional regulator [Armatimonadota bacterium]